MNRRVKPDTVAFERGKDYYYERGVENRRSGNLQDALKLLKLATQKDPNDGKTLLEAALAAAQLNMPELSGRYLTRAMEAGCCETGLLYALAKRLKTLGRMEEAIAALNALRNLRTPDEYSSLGMEDLLDISRGSLQETNDRALDQELSLLSRACGCMARGDEERGRKQLEECLQRAGDLPLIRAMYAYSIVENDPDRALELAKAALAGSKKEPSSAVRVACVCSEILRLCGDDAGRSILTGIAFDDIRQDETEMYLQALAGLGEHEQIRTFCLTRLKGGEFDRTLLHALSVSACALQMDPEQRLTGWKRILEIDETDTVALMFTARADSIIGTPEEYRCVLTQGMKLEVLYRCDRALQQGRLNGGRADEELLRILTDLAYSEDDENLQRAAVQILTVYTGKTELLAVRPDIPETVRKEITDLLQPGRMEELKRKYPACVNALQPAPDFLLRTQSPWVKRLYLNALDYMAGRGELYGQDTLMKLLLQTISHRRTRQMCLSNTVSAEAALVYLCFEQMGEKIPKKEILWDYALRPRQLERMLRLITEELPEEER